MWYYGKTVKYVSSYSNSKSCHVIMDGIAGHTGWIKIAANSTDGVTNILSILTAANANSRQVNVNIASNQITGVYMS